jgi:hypothetical protein
MSGRACAASAFAKKGDVSLNIHEDFQMSLTAQELLNSFDRLPDVEQRTAMARILGIASRLD